MPLPFLWARRCQTFAPSFRNPMTPDMYKCNRVWIERPWWVRSNRARTRCLWKPYYSPRVQQSASFHWLLWWGTSFERWSNHPLLFAWYFRTRLQAFPSVPKWYFVAQQLIISLVTDNSKLCLEIRETRLKLKPGYPNPGQQFAHVGTTMLELHGLSFFLMTVVS